MALSTEYPAALVFFKRRGFEYFGKYPGETVQKEYSSIIPKP